MANKINALPGRAGKFIKDHQLAPYLVYAVFFILFMFIYRFMFLNIGDDAVAGGHIDIENSSMREVISFAYSHGREIFCRYWYTVICYVLRKIHGGILWRPVIGGSYVVSAFALGKLFPISGETPVKNAVISCFAILLFPLLTMGEAGWLSTSVVYVLPLAFVLCGAIGLKKCFLGQRIRWYGYPFYLFCMYMGTCHEQTSTLFFGLTLVMICWKILQIILRKKNKQTSEVISVPSDVFLILNFLLCTFQCFRAVTWPSNTERLSSEIRLWFVEYLSLEPYDKLYLGFQDTMKYIITRQPMTLTILTVLICMTVFVMYRDTFYRILAVIPAGIMLVFGFGSSFFETWFPDLDYLFGENVGIRNFINIRQYMSTIIALFLIFLIMIDIYLIFRQTFGSLFFAALFFGGLCTRFIMGFSASLYASLYRTAFFLFMTMIVIIFRLLSELRMRSHDKAYKAAVGIVVFFGTLSLLDLILHI